MPRARSFSTALVLLLAATTSRADDVSGTWKAAFDSPVGVQRYTFTFQVDGETLTGSATARIGDRTLAPTDLKEGTLKGDQIAFTEALSFGDQPITIRYTGTIKGDEIAFKRQVGTFAAEEFVARRAKPGEPEPERAPAPRRPAAGRPDMPRPGPVPLPILPALAAYDDASFYAETNVPHGRVEQATYTDLAGNEKRMHVYLPPGYDDDPQARFPVLYLNHGGGDDDSAWTNTDPRRGGAAHRILDNLLAAGKAKPMIVVMPNTRGLASAQAVKPGEDDACAKEYLQAIIPAVESRYRTKPGRENRALAGLSMGGFVVLNTGLPHLDTFSELYVFSSGYLGDQQQVFAENFAPVLSDPKTNDLLRVPFYMGQGETDIALRNGQKVMAEINRHGVRNFWVLSSGGHEWANWRRYLHQTAQIMFPEDATAVTAPARAWTGMDSPGPIP